MRLLLILICGVAWGQITPIPNSSGANFRAAVNDRLSTLDTGKVGLTAVVTKPAAPTVTALCNGSACGGSTTWKYAVVAITAAGGIMSDPVTITDGNSTLNSTHYNRIVIPAVTKATSCLVYRFLDGGGTSNGSYGNGLLSSNDGNTYIDHVPCGTTITDEGRVGWFFTPMDWLTGPVSSSGVTAPTFASTGAGFGSEQFGFLTYAFGTESVAFGFATSADFNAVAIGSNTVAEGGGVSIGYNTHAAGNGAVALGASANAIGGGGVAIGGGTTAGELGIAIGTNVQAPDAVGIIGNSNNHDFYFGFDGTKSRGRLHVNGIRDQSTAARPTCDVSTRGLIMVEKGTGTDGADVPVLCAQTSSTGPTFGWLTIGVQ